MNDKKKLKLKKFYLHPVTTFILLTLFVMIISGIFSLFGAEATYSTLNPANGNLETNLVAVENLFSFDGVKYIISNATKNFVSFTTLSNLLIALIGLGIMQATGLLDAFIKRRLSKTNTRRLLFTIIFIATVSSLVNDIGYVILIPLAAIIFHKTNRNPLAGIVAAFCGVAFGYGVTLFVGSMEVNLVGTTELAAQLVDETYHVALTSNLIAIITSTIIVSIAGTFIVEKVIIPKLGRYNNRNENDFSKTTEIEVIESIEEEEQQKLKDEIYEKKGMRSATIVAIIFLLFFAYSLIPNLPFSGMLLDMDETTYLGQVFGPNAYFQDGFTFVVSLFFILTGIAYGLSAKTLTNDRDLLIDSSKYIQEVTLLIPMVFFATEFVAVFRKTNLATVITAWGANIINNLDFTGLPLIILIVLVIAIINIFNTPTVAKWTILAPIVIPKLMLSNVSPEFGQFILRATDSMTNGITPLLTYFVIFVGYLNIYNPNKRRPITIGRSLKMIMPYCLIISLVWLVIVLLWYITGIPIGPNVYPTL